MSGALAAVSTLGSTASQALTAAGLMPALIRQPRKIGTIIPDVSIEEINTSRQTVTQHPVANNTPISDHAFMLPQEVIMRCGWSNADPVGATVQGFLTGGVSGALQGLASSALETRARTIYAQLLALQVSRQPFQLMTGKKTYPTMMCLELRATTDHTSEYALMVEAHFQEMQIATVQVTTAPVYANQATPASTAANTDTGTKQATPADNSTILYKLGNSLFGATGAQAPQ
jgi:hypothetical protein